MIRPRRLLFCTRLCALFVFTAGAAHAQFTETNGVARVEAEVTSTNIARSVGGVTYTWTTVTDTPGFSGTGYIEAVPSDGTSTNTVVSNWETASPQVNYSVTFSNTGTYYVWVRGYAGDASSAGLYIGLNGTSPAASRLDMAQYNAWTWANTAAGSATPVGINIPSPGTYTLNLWMRDSGLDVDRILLTRNPNFSPNPDANFWRNQNIYQIITDRFFNADTNNDVAGLPNFGATNGGQAHGGDFKGIEQKLDYIKALGATAIWISPVLKNANGDYHGYAATDFYAVNPRMGTLADLQSLVREAQKRGLLVVNDVVVNHGSTWVDSAEAGWGTTFRFPPSGYTLKYNSSGQQYAAPFANTNLTANFGNTNLANIFHNNCGGIPNYGDPTQVELGELASLDDFKTETTYIRDRMKEIWTYWINAAGFDAYRIDTVKHVEMGFWDTWSPAIRSAALAADKPNFLQFGEIFDGSDSKVGSYTGTKSGGNYKMGSVLDYPLYYQVGSVFGSGTGNTGQIESRYNNLTTANYDASALDSLVLNLDNHDNPRFLATTGSSTTRLEVALAFMYTTRGIPSLYYGTEQDFNGGADPANREDMFDGLYEQGPSLGDNFNMTSARFKLVAKLNNLRRLYPALRTGTHINLWANFGGPGLLAYARRLNGEEAYVVLNTASTAQTIGARPTIHPAGTVLVDALNPTNTLTVASGIDGIPLFSMPALSCRIYVAQSQVRALSTVVNSITPTHDSTGISPASSITVNFSQAMNTASVQSAFSTTPASTGNFVWSSGNTVVTYTPSSNLAGNTVYALRIGDSATDSTGLAMHGAFESRFTTGAASSTARPSINSFSSSGVTETSASLAAAVTPNGTATTVFFEYGTDAVYGSTVPGQAIGSGNSPINVSASLTGLAAGTTYHYRVYATNSVGTTLGEDATFDTSAPLPQITTTAASYVTTTTTSLNGTVNPNGLQTSVYFRWGTRSEDLTSQTSAQNVGSGSANIAFWAELSGLQPDTTYFFQAVAVNGSNVVPGSVLSFHTLPVKPTVTTLATTNVTVTNAVLPATVNPNGSESIYFFEYGTNSSFGASTVAQSAGGGTNAVSVSATLSNLAAGQTYYYRAAASNAFGISYASSQNFTAGLPPPSVATLTPTGLTTNASTLRGAINPNNSFASAWFEWGTTTNYGSTSRILATDTMEGLSAFNLAGGAVSGGTGFGNYSRYSIGTGAGTFLAINSSNQTIDGTKSIGAYAGTAAGVSFRRSVSTTRQFGSMLASARFNVDNTKGFSGFNLKSANGSGSGGFGSGELVSFGVAPASGNNGILVTDSSGQRVLDLGADVRNTILDFKVDFDAQNRRYVVGAKFRTNASFTKISGTMSGTGTIVSHVGFANWNSTGAFQDLMVDSLQVLGSTALGGGTNSITVSNLASGLSANTLYNYRIASMNLDGGITYGENATFYTGIDLAVTKTNSGGALTQGGTGTFTINVSNVGASPSSGTVTVTELPPAGMTVTAMTGSGWTIDTNALTATRSGSLATNSSYPPIAVSVAVAENAPSVLTNSVTLSGGGDGNLLNNTAVAAAAVSSGPDLSISKVSGGTFRQGEAGSFVVTVSNIGGAASSGTVTVTEQPPAGMTVASMTGSGWTFDSNSLTATRADSLLAGTNYSPITVGVSIASNAPAALTNSAAVAGIGDANSGNNSAQSIARISPALAPIDAWRTLHFGTTDNSGVAADTYVSTGDGMPNLLKYALGLNPTNGAAISEKPSLQTFPPLAIKFRRAKDATDVTMNVEATESVINAWTNVWSSKTNAYSGGSNTVEEVTVQDPISETNALQRYLRLKVTRP
ncbi:MAG: Ig-like domain-containing protein [Chthoniobacterales bacterium]|nr:Ig-like domain-containing protein [Chthoniobacterales bacterium]